MTRKPLLTLAALALSGSIAFAQAPPTPPPDGAAPAPQAAPVERRPGGPGMRGGGPQGRGGGSDNYRSTDGKSRYRGHGSYRGGPGGGMMMGGGYRIAPPGMWWRSPSVVQKLTLTPDQTKKMDDIFQAARLQLIGLKANVETQSVMLEPMLSANPPDTVKTLAQIDKVAQARAELEKANAKMLLGIRGVLTPDQWTKLRAGGPGGFGRPGDGDGGQGGGGYGRGRGPGGPGGPRGGDDFVAPNPQP